MVDMRNVNIVEVTTSPHNRNMWVNVDGINILRIYEIENLYIDEVRQGQKGTRDELLTLLREHHRIEKAILTLGRKFTDNEIAEIMEEV